MGGRGGNGSSFVSPDAPSKLFSFCLLFLCCCPEVNLFSLKLLIGVFWLTGYAMLKCINASLKWYSLEAYAFSLIEYNGGP